MRIPARPRDGAAGMRASGNGVEKGDRRMLTALVLVCSMAITPELRDCDRSNAVTVLQVPEAFGNPVMCMMHGQACLAGTAIGRDLRADERVKVLCIRAEGRPVRDVAAE
jgi:hypothetical protein